MNTRTKNRMLKIAEQKTTQNKMRGKKKEKLYDWLEAYGKKK